MKGVITSAWRAWGGAERVSALRERRPRLLADAAGPLRGRLTARPLAGARGSIGDSRRDGAWSGALPAIGTGGFIDLRTATVVPANTMVRQAAIAASAAIRRLRLRP